ncbi:MAG: hypothetical protein J1F24_04335 [Oscillospiraceae bacterium]|nr:hypothetical protein [Oscillospiraceae bacterium]
MALSEEKVREYMKRLLMTRMRILCNHGFYGLLLMHMIYSIDEGSHTAYTDGERIAFGPEFLDSLSDSELDFIMIHEILHVVLQHCLRGDVDDPERYNIAADIVVNSNIMLENGGKPSSITLSKHGVSMHTAPDGKEGHLYTAEEVYEMLPPSPKKGKPSALPGSKDGIAQKEQAKRKNVASNPGMWDDHTQWGKFEYDSILREVWVKRFADICEAVTIRDPSNSRGTLPMFAKRMLEELTKPQNDWRSILNEFVQEEINDYSFSPPDRRFQDSPFFLPDFNEMGESDEVEDILFMIDTSGSISDKMMTAAYSEIKGAIDQFNGKLRGWLGFFDAAIIEPKPFSSFEEFIAIRPAGGGGTDFQIIFEYVDRYMQDTPPASVIVLTDGYAPFPKEELAKGIPVLWLINNEEVDPPWGKVARIKI